MKTIKIKVQLTKEQESIYRQCTEELTWLWNKLLSNELYNHCLKWYSWAEKKSKEASKVKTKSKKKSESDANKFDEFLPFDLENIIRCPLQFGNSAYTGATCKIAYGGNYWKKDESVKIAYKHYPNSKNKEVYEIRYKHGYQLVKGDKPYTRVKVQPHIYKSIDMADGKIREFKKAEDHDNLTALNILRHSEGLTNLTVKSDFVGGLIRKDFKAAWDAFLDVNLLSRKKLRFKQDDDTIKTLTNVQNPPKIDFRKNLISVTGFGNIQVTDKDYEHRLNADSFIPCSYSLTKKPSGYYICVVIAHPLHKQIKDLRDKQIPAAKKQHGEESEQYTELKSKLDYLVNLVKESEFKPQHKRDNGIEIGVDPGVNAVAATDNGMLFKPNISRERIEIHIEKLQNQLSRIRSINDANWKAAGNKVGRLQTKNEAKLQVKITRLHEKAANSTKAFNHKLSTRLARMGNVAWEDTKIQNLIKQTAPKLSGEHQGYDKNGASAKAGLNRKLRMRSLGDLKAQTKHKVEKMGGIFKEPPAHNSSKTCNCCGTIGKRTEQHLFICENSDCDRFNQPVQADVNAAKNHKRNAGFSSVPTKSYNTDKLRYSKPTRFKNSVKR